MTPAPAYSPDPELRQELLDATVRCAERARSLLAVVQRESECLQAGALEDLPDVTSEKTENLARLERADQRWRALFARTGLPDGRQGVRQLLRGADPELQKAWADLESTLESLQALNEANGRLIHRNLDHNRRLLDVFFLDEREQTPVTYGTDGAQQQGARRRAITRA